MLIHSLNQSVYMHSKALKSIFNP